MLFYVSFGVFWLESTGFIAGIVAGIIKSNIEAILAGIVMGKKWTFSRYQSGYYYKCY